MPQPCVWRVESHQIEMDLSRHWWSKCQCFSLSYSLQILNSLIYIFVLRVFELAFPHVDEKARLPCSLVKEAVDVAVYFFCTPEYSSEVSQATVELTIRQSVDSLLHDKLVGNSAKSQAQTGSILRAVNRVSTGFQAEMYQRYYCYHSCLLTWMFSLLWLAC